MITNELLYAIRNELPMRLTITRLGRFGPIAKQSDGHFRFQCPQQRTEGDGEPEQQLGSLFLLKKEHQQHRLDDVTRSRV